MEAAGRVGFTQFGLDDRLLRALTRMNFSTPTHVQEKCLPLALEGMDVLVKARTGSGKTVAYALPITHSILRNQEGVVSPLRDVQAIVLVPTRELCEQVHSVFATLTIYTGGLVRVCQIGGDVPMEAQRSMLLEKPEVVISTPGRLVKHLKAHNTDLSSVKYLVIDEADLVLSFGYTEDIQTIVESLPSSCQSFLMSATMSEEVEGLTSLVLHNPALVKLEEPRTESEGTLAQFTIHCKENDKFLLSYALIKLKLLPGKTIFFVNHVNRGYRLRLFLERFSIRSVVLNAELPISSRFHILHEFNKDIFDYLIATDEAVEEPEKKEEVEEKEEEEEEKDDDDDDDQKKKKKKKKKKEKEKKKKKKGKETTEQESHPEFGVSRGVDFRNVQTVINFDFPQSVRSYVHRIGRTARAKASGASLSLVTSDDEKMLAKVTAHLKDQEMKPLSLDLREVETFRYRVEDVLRGVTRTAIRDARLLELKQEMLNSEKLKAHFEDNPADLHLLRHDAPLAPSSVAPHLKVIPSYLLPKAPSGSPFPALPRPAQESRDDDKRKRRDRGGRFGGRKRAKQDPLKSFTYTRAGRGRGKK